MIPYITAGEWGQAGGHPQEERDRWRETAESSTRRNTCGRGVNVGDCGKQTVPWQTDSPVGQTQQASVMSSPVLLGCLGGLSGVVPDQNSTSKAPEVFRKTKNEVQRRFTHSRM